MFRIPSPLLGGLRSGAEAGGGGGKGSEDHGEAEPSGGSQKRPAVQLQTQHPAAVSDRADAISLHEGISLSALGDRVAKSEFDSLETIWAIIYPWGSASSHISWPKLPPDCKIPENRQALRARLSIGQARTAVASLDMTTGLLASKLAMVISEALKNHALWSEAAAIHGYCLWAKGNLAAGFELMDAAARRAEQHCCFGARYTAIWLKAFASLRLYDPSAARECHNITVPLLGDRSGRIFFVVSSPYLAFGSVTCGDLNGAKQLLDVTPHKFGNALIRIAEGNWDLARSALLQGRLWCGTQDSALRESFTFWLARVYRLNCQWALATKTLKGLIAMNRGLNLVPQEVRARSELALIHAQTNKPKAARKELNSCRQLMGAEDWRGLSGLVARANGSALAAEGKIRRARLEFERAIDILFDYHLPWEHAEALTCWGWSLCNAGDDSGREKLRAARSIYKHYGAGNPWIERVVDDRWRKEFHTSSGDAHSSVDADPATVSTSFNRRTTAKGVGPARSAEGDAAFAKAADLRLLTAATHDAISHLMYAINKASGLRRPIEHMADSLDRISRNLFRTKGEFTTPYRLLRPGPQSNGRSK